MTSVLWTSRLRLDPTSFIAPGAIVTGEVALGPRASVWFHTTIRGDSAAVTLGADSNVQDGSVVHEDLGFPVIVGERVTIGHGAIIHGCVIEDDCLIGMGAILLTGARIGTGSLIAAGSLVREGEQIPAESLVVGAPARVLGPVSTTHRQAIVNGATHYAALAQSYRERGFAIPHPLPSRDTGRDGREPRAMSFLEWEHVIGALAESPRVVAELCSRFDVSLWKRPPGVGRWSALEVLCHLRDADRDVYLPRLGRMLVENAVAVEDVEMRDWDTARRYADADLAAVLEDWRAARAELIERLRPLGPDDWARTAVHSRRGPFPLGAMVREWAEHDLSHRHQIARALEARS